MKNKKTEEKRIKIGSRIVYVIPILLSILSTGTIVVFAINFWSEGYKVDSGSTNKLVQYSKPGGFGCGYVDNYTGSSIFVPTRSEAEWISFSTYEPANVNGCTGDSNNYSGNPNWYTATNNCGSWDYNCDGVVDKEYLTATGDAIFVICNPFDPSHCDEGYTESPTPGCGEEGTWNTGRCLLWPLIPPYWGCTWDSHRVQKCH